MRKFIAFIAVLAIAFSCAKEQDTDAYISSDAEDGIVLFAGVADQAAVKISTDASNWTATPSDLWISVTPSSGSGSAEITISVDENAGVKRYGRVSIRGGGAVYNLSIHQAGAGEDKPSYPGGIDPNDDTPDPKGTVIPRESFSLATDWGVTGSIMDLGWALNGEEDLPMMAEPTGWMAAFDVVVEQGQEFKFRKEKAWTTNLGATNYQPYLNKKYPLADNGQNFKLAAGTYDLYVHPTFMLLYVLTAGEEFAYGDATQDQTVGENVRIFILNNSSWKTPFLYTYTGKGELEPYGRWPGMYANGTKEIGDYTWTYWEASGFNGVSGINIIINDGGEHQYPAPDETDKLWSGLTIMNSLYFVWDGKKVTRVEDPLKPGVSGYGIKPTEISFGTSAWTIIGDAVGGWEYVNDVPMDTQGYWEVAKNVNLTASKGFKFRQDRAWAANFGCGENNDGTTPVSTGSKISLTSGGNNMAVSSTGKYDVYLCVENGIAYILKAGAAWTHEAEGKPDYSSSGIDYNMPVANKAGGLTYQVNVFSFKDSNNDGIGDFNGLSESMDYFDKLGVTALWLSPIQPAQSYHGYDVTDYETVNREFGTMEDFQNLVTTAHEHNIRIYIDYVMNHSGDQNKWFLDIKQNGKQSPYWNYYSLSKNPQSDCQNGRIAQVDDRNYDKYKWYPVTIGGGGKKRYKIDLDWTNSSAPKMTVSETTADPTTAGAQNNPARYLYWGGGTYTQFYDNGTNKYTLTLDYQSEWGCLVRTTREDTWTGKTKWGFNTTGDQMKLGVAHTLYSDNNPDNVQSIVMPGGELYYYYTEFGTGMFVDFNYGTADNCQNSDAFKAIVASADKWLAMGVDGFRLDAVKHIYHVEAGRNNIVFWKKFYDACNTLYKKYSSKRSGLTNPDPNIFMVGEVLSGDGDCTKFYEGLPALFEFQFWWDLRECINNGDIYRAGYNMNFPQSLKGRWDGHRAVRGSAISTPKLSNHDEDRTASQLGNNKNKIRLAACVLLTAPGRPYIYQGEELGYWGTKAGGDEYVRTPILWTPNLSSAASKKLYGKIDKSMLTASISVEKQSADETSLLNLYRNFAAARNTHPALANGEPDPDSITQNGYDGHIAGWYMHEVGNWDNAVLVLHNLSGWDITVDRSSHGNDLSHILASNGKVKVTGSSVFMPAYSSVVFDL